jgi:pimeloyl-ACP methyl ester carboxylesterase
MLNGGPGGSSLEFEVGYGPLVQSAIPDAEILLVDHRGVGSSDRLGCPEESPGSIAGEQISDEELAPCLGSVRARFTPAELAAFSTTNAARDVGELIERARRPGLPVFVYGASYGTYWAQRWLQLYPDQADGAILDSICSPGECRFLATQYDRSNDVGLDLLRMCADDADCRAHLGADPGAFALDVLRRLDSGHCPELAERGIDRRIVQAIASSLLEEVQMRQAVPALFARVDRCSARDVEALFTLVERLFVASPSLGGGTPSSFAPVLYFLVTRSEMWELPTVDYTSRRPRSSTSRGPRARPTRATSSSIGTRTRRSRC